MVKLEISEKFKDARLVENQHGKQTMGQVEAATGVSQSMISDLENEGKRKVNYLDVVKLANHYGVSLDWLIGGAEVPSADPKLQEVCKYTGLSQNAVLYLHQLSELEKKMPNMGRRLYLLSDLLEKRNKEKQCEFDVFLAYLQNYVRLKTMPKPDVDAVNNAWGTIALDYLKSAGLIAALPDDLAKMEFDGRISDTLKKMLDEIAADRKAAANGTDGKEGPHGEHKTD